MKDKFNVFPGDSYSFSLTEAIEIAEICGEILNFHGLPTFCTLIQIGILMVRAFSSKPTRRKGKSSRNNQERPPSQGELVRSTEFVDNRWQHEHDEVEEELELGLGDWDSDDDAALPRGKQR